DLCVGGAGGNTVINTHGTAEACTGLNSTGSDPVQVLIIDNPANAPAATAATTLAITVGLGSSSSPPGRIRVVVDDGGAGATFDPAVATNSPTLQGHPGAAGAAAVGAAAFFHTPACGVSPATLEDYSALGGAPILFDSAGTRMGSPTVRPKPDFVGPDGGNNTFLGFQLKNSSNPNFKDNSTVAQCQNNASFPNFFGTSAATPHAAAIAALMLQANPALTPSQIYDALRQSALAMGGATPNFNSGSGFIQADAALKLLPPGPPSLSFSPASVTEGGSATLTWSSINTASCTASGSWSGTQMTSGSAMITAPMTAGDAAYTLTCSNPKGSAAATVHLTVTAPPKSGGGGGALDELTALVLAALCCGRLLLRRAGPAVSSRRSRGP
ncbi:MAG TPA: S8 family serine peptidase, partial [Steroidobacteraceae bacterium]|nr:S8 family serine peptidase [Steroidobacteraceae bacterium]